MKVFFNGKLREPENVKVPAISSGVYYGAGCFETLRSYSGKFLHLNKHINRLKRGLNWLGVTENKGINTEKLQRDIRNLLAANNLDKDDARVRIQAVLNESNGYQFSDSVRPDLIITAEPYKVTTEPVKLCTVSTRTIPGNSRPADLKLSNMLHYRQAYREAQLKGCDDGLLLNSNGFISETSISNIFWLKGTQVYTPSANCDILPGIMRETVMELILNMENHEIGEGEYKPEEIAKADQVWLTNSVREIRWVKEIDGREYSTDSQFRFNLEKALESYKEEHLK